MAWFSQGPLLYVGMTADTIGGASDEGVSCVWCGLPEVIAAGRVA
jgi:hypothetical protein